MFSCKILEHSISEAGSNLATVLVTFPRVCLAEFVTHRLNSDSIWGDESVICERFTLPDMSKNSSSSRAVPFKRMLESVRNNPYIPQWTLNRPGMQGDYVSDFIDQRERERIISEANVIWDSLLSDALNWAEALHNRGIHKQDCNRILEPFSWVTQVITSSNWNNFFALRCHEAAFPPFRKIARMIFLKMRKSTPTLLKYGQWHLPFVSPEEKKDFFWEPEYDKDLPYLIKLSASRCAWVSYANHDKDATEEAVLRTYIRLLGESPVHASPIEHQATPWFYNINSWRSNLTGWVQARKLISNESNRTFNPTQEEIDSWPESKEV